MTTPPCGASVDAVATLSSFAGTGFCRNCSTPARMTSAASAGDSVLPSASRRRRMARACSWDTRDSFTPISRPISFIVTSL
jgi:hypothetical protein